MPLFTDGNPADVEYLRSYESSILDVAASEGIDIDAKLALAASEVGDEILTFLTTQGAPELQAQRRKAGMRAVVVTPALRRWHATHTLALVFRDAYGSQLNERYATQMKEYRLASRQAAGQYFAIGAGLVLHPIAKPDAAFVSSGSEDGAPYYVQIAWVGKDGNESAPSDVVLLNLEAGSVVGSPLTFDDVAGWNLYIGDSREKITRQNDAPLALGFGWVFAGALQQGGAAPGTGQKADYFMVDFHRTRRG